MARSFFRLSSVIVVVALTVGLSFGQGTKITVLHVNDTHSHLDAFGPKNPDLSGTIGGIAKTATVIGTLRATEPNVLLLHAGDAFVGDFFFNAMLDVPEFMILKQLEVDAMAVGNHEFEFGPGILDYVLTTAFAGGAFPLLAANVDVTGYPSLGTWIQPAITKEIAGVKVGIFGMTLPGNPTTNSGPVVISDNIGVIAGEQMAQLRGSGAQVVIMLSHLGIYLDRIIAANVPGIDVIVGGHDHFAFAQPEQVVNPVGGKTLIVQAGSFYRYVGKLSLTVDGGAVAVDGYELVPVDASVPPVPALQGIVDNLKSDIVGLYGNVYTSQVATAVTDLEETFDPSKPWRDTPLGNLLTDSYRAKTNTQIALTALGLISEKIYAGPIVGADIFRSVSYGYDPGTGLGLKLVTGTIAGSELMKGIELGLSQLEITDDYMLQVSGMEFAYNAKRPAGNRLIPGSLRINGKPFHAAQKYSVTMNDGISMLLGILGITVEDITILPDLEYVVLRDYFASLESVSMKQENRIVDMGVTPFPKGFAMGRGAVTNMAAKHGCYPNPFNPATSISFELPQASHVTLKVFNMLGQEVASLADDDLPAGVHQRTFDAKNLATGAYFYRLSVAGDVQVARIMLLK